MNKNSHLILALLLAALLPLNSWGKENTGQLRVSRNNYRTSAACLPATSTSELNINNVRSLLQNGGDMWWDLVSNPRYEVPKVDDPSKAKYSLFAGSLWIGGIDASGQLRIAAQTYRQSGNDYFPGPLRIDNTASTEDVVCKDFDRHFKIEKTEIDAFRSDIPENRTAVKYPNVFAWPGNANKVSQNVDAGFNNVLAPWVDMDGDDLDYNPAGGDYPAIIGDQAIWWVLNDKGEVHSETRGEQIGVEMQIMAFAFATSNSVNNMTFYKQKVVNRSTFTLNDTYIGQWVDADLGYAFDDYVGCDTVRGLGYCYNGDNNDNLPQGYGLNPPAIGVDFFQGPRADNADVLLKDSIDNNSNGKIDEPAEAFLKMAKFIYYDNDFGVRGNPTQASHYYGYLTGFWKNGSKIVDDRAGNSNGFPEQGEIYTATSFMFPDYPGGGCASKILYDTVPEYKEVVQPFDRRFIQSAGPFKLKPGLPNEIIIGVVWARDENNAYDADQYGSICKMLEADDIAQALFDSNFDLLDGPDAPDLSITEFDQELVLTWENKNATSNNYYENYSEIDPILGARADLTEAQKRFDFEGYLVYQLLDGTVSATQLNDASKARLVAQCDVKNGVSTIINRSTTNVAGETEPIIVDEVMVEGKDEGLSHSIRLTNDLFPEGTNTKLINYRPYYYCVIAYAWNDVTSDGRKFVPGNGNFKRVSAMPHKTEFERFGTTLNSAYGLGPEIKQMQGRGSGGIFTKFNSITDSLVTKNYSVAQPVYAANAGPIQVKVVNPKEIKAAKYQVEITGDSLLEEISQNGEALKVYADWILYDVSGGQRQEVYTSKFTRRVSDTSNTPLPGIMNGEEKYITQRVGDQLIDHGFSIAVNNVTNPGNTLEKNNGYVGSSITFNDKTKPWYFGLPDQDNFENFNWIRAGAPCIPEKCKEDLDYANKGSLPEALNADNSNWVQYLAKVYDPNSVYESILQGTWAPYCMTAHFHTTKDIIGVSLKSAYNYVPGSVPPSPSFGEIDPKSILTLEKLPNVDIVMTSDPDKWSRCVVVETSPTKTLGSGAHILTAKWRKSLSQSDVIAGKAAEAPTDGSTDYGMSYFPGYAINLDNGERLNIFFGESTWHRAQNGDDMLFNPTVDPGNDFKAIAGRHYIYVTNQKYDECASIAQKLRVPINELATINAPTPYAFGTTSSLDDIQFRIDDVYSQIAWSSIGFISSAEYLFKKYEDIPTDVRISLRVQRQFEKDPNNGGNPIYEFDLEPYAPSLKVQEVGSASLQNQMNVVPNPYYGRSGVGMGRYEKNQLDSRVKLTNLPQKCTIRIYTLNGSLIRTYKKDNDLTNIEWDLKNENGVPIGSGLYIIHVDAGALGVRTMKFFAIMPELDLNAY